VRKRWGPTQVCWLPVRVALLPNKSIVVSFYTFFFFTFLPFNFFYQPNIVYNSQIKILKTKYILVMKFQLSRKNMTLYDFKSWIYNLRVYYFTSLNNIITYQIKTYIFLILRRSWEFFVCLFVILAKYLEFKAHCAYLK
jgi:hypothetical protein